MDFEPFDPRMKLLDILANEFVYISDFQEHRRLDSYTGKVEHEVMFSFRMTPQVISQQQRVEIKRRVEEILAKFTKGT